MAAVSKTQAVTISRTLLTLHWAGPKAWLIMVFRALAMAPGWDGSSSSWAKPLALRLVHEWTPPATLKPGTLAFQGLMVTVLKLEELAPLAKMGLMICLFSFWVLQGPGVKVDRDVAQYVCTCLTVTSKSQLAKPQHGGLS